MKTLVGYNGDTPIYKNDNCEQNKTDMKQELKNCAHCNGAAKVVPIIERHLGGSRAFYVECYECGARSRQHACENIAINAWNTRPDHSGESAEIAKGKTTTTEISWEERKFSIASQYALLRISSKMANGWSPGRHSFEEFQKSVIRNGFELADNFVELYYQRYNEEV